MISQATYDAVKKFLNGDGKKTTEWFLTKNRSLGELSPLDMIKMGRQKKLEKFIFTMVDENRR